MLSKMEKDLKLEIEKLKKEKILNNKELAFQNDEKEKRADELNAAYINLASMNNQTLDDLEEAGNVFGNIVANAPIPIIIHAEDGEVLNLSCKWTELTDYAKSDIPTIFEWTKRAYGQNKEEVEEFIQKLYSLTETQHDGEFEVTTKSGKVLTWDFHSSCIGKLPDGRSVAMSIATDVTEKQKRDQENLKLSEKVRNTETLLKASLESPKDMIILSIDTKYNYNYFNKNHKDTMLNIYSANVEIGANILDQISIKSDRIKAKRNYMKALGGEAHSIVESYGIDNAIYFESFFYPIYNAENIVIGASVFSRDITRRKQQEQVLVESFDRLDRSQMISNVGSWELDLKTNLIWGSQEAFNIYELPRDSEFIDIARVQGMTSSKDRKVLKQALQDLIENRNPYDVFFTLEIGTEKKYIHSRASLTIDSSGKPIKVLGVIRDVTEINMNKKKLVKEKEQAQKYSSELKLLGSIFENSIVNAPVPIMIHAEDGSVLNLSRKWTELTYYTKEDIPTISKWTKQAYGRNKDIVISFVKSLYASPETLHESEFEVTTKDGRKLIWDFNSGVIGKLSDGRSVAMSVATDVTDLKRKESELIYISYHDSLTGLYNRRYYEDRLSILDVTDNYPLTVVMSDINGLKLINDAFGHSAGDKLLIAAGKVIKDSCREADLVARIGGDEFLIAMPNTSGAEAEKIISVINEKAKKIFVESIELSISFGFATKNEISVDLQETFRSAEDQMYRAKLNEIPSMRSGAIETILNTLYEKDKNSEIHSRTVSEISEKLAVAYGMNSQEVSEVKTAGLLHDIGKIIIPISIITKKGKLTEAEYTLIKGHPEIGFRILNSTHDLRSISSIVLNHHERWDGFGYPRGVKAQEVPLQSRIIAIADAFDAMTSPRAYRETSTNQEALNEIKKYAGTQFDPDLAKVFAENFKEIIQNEIS